MNTVDTSKEVACTKNFASHATQLQEKINEIMKIEKGVFYDHGTSSAEMKYNHINLDKPDDDVDVEDAVLLRIFPSKKETLHADENVEKIQKELQIIFAQSKIILSKTAQFTIVLLHTFSTLLKKIDGVCAKILLSEYLGKHSRIKTTDAEYQHRTQENIIPTLEMQTEMVRVLQMQENKLYAKKSIFVQEVDAKQENYIYINFKQPQKNYTDHTNQIVHGCVYEEDKVSVKEILSILYRKLREGESF